MRKLLLSLLCLFTAVLCAQATEHTVTVDLTSSSNANAYAALNKSIGNTGFTLYGWTMNNTAGASLNYTTSRACMVQLGTNTNDYTIKKISIVYSATGNTWQADVYKSSTCYSQVSKVLSSYTPAGEKIGSFKKDISTPSPYSVDINDKAFCINAIAKGQFFIESITITYDDAKQVDPEWSLEAPASPMVGVGFNLIKNKVDGLKYTYTLIDGDYQCDRPSQDGYLIDDDGSIYLLRTGELTLQVESGATGTYSKKTQTLSLSVGKMPYPAGWKFNGEIVKNSTITCKSDQVDIKFVTIPDFFNGVTNDIVKNRLTELFTPLCKRTEASSSDDNVLTLSGDNIHIVGNGEATATVSYDTNEALVEGGDCTLTVNVVDASLKNPTWTFESTNQTPMLGDELTFTLNTVANEPSVVISYDENKVYKVEETVGDQKVIKYYPKVLGEITLTASSSATDGYLEKSETLTFDVQKRAIALDWKQGENSVKGQTVQINMAKNNAPSLVEPTLPAIFEALNIASPEFEVVAANGATSSYDYATKAFTFADGTSTFTAQAKADAAANANYNITSAAVTVKVGYPQPAWTATVPATAKVAEALDFGIKLGADGVVPTVKCETADGADAQAKLFKASDGKYYFLESGTYKITISSELTTDVAIAKSLEPATIIVGKMPYTLAWMLDGKSINGTSIQVKTSETNLPTLTHASIPEVLNGKLTAPTFDITFDPETPKALTFDAATGAFTLTGKEETVKITAVISPENASFEGSATVTLDVNNARTYEWVNSGKGNSATNAVGSFEMGSQTWDYVVENPLIVYVGAGMQFGKSGQAANKYTITNSTDYVGKLVKSILFECTTNATNASIRLLADGNEILSDTYSSTRTKFEWSVNTVVSEKLAIEFGTEGAKYIKPNKLTIIYSELQEGQKILPAWEFVQNETWTLGNGYNAPEAIKLPEGLTITLTPNEDDIVVAEDGKWYPKHAGKVNFTASSVASGMYEAKSVTVQYNVAKADYLLGWKLGEETLANNHTLKCLTTETNLPVVAVQRTLPEVLKDIVTYPEYSVSTTAPTTGAVATFDIASNVFTLTGTQGSQTFTVSLKKEKNEDGTDKVNENFNDATFNLTLNVDNTGQYSWAQTASNITMPGSGYYSEANLTLGDLNWQLNAPEKVYLQKLSGVKVGANGSANCTYTLTPLNAPFVGKLINKITLKGSNSSGNNNQIAILVDGAEVYRGNFSNNTYTMDTPVYCENNMQIVGISETNASTTFSGITVDYESNATVVTNPVWSVADCTWTLGNEYDMPLASHVQSGVTVTVVPKNAEADFKVTEGGKYIPKHAGTITMVASSEATDRYNARGPIEFTVTVPKLDYVLGWEYDGAMLENSSVFNCSTTDKNLPVLKVATLPDWITAPILNVSTNPEGVVEVENFELKPIGEGTATLVVAYAATDDVNAASYTLEVRVSDVIAAPTANVKDKDEIRVDFPIELSTTVLNAEIYYKIDRGEDVLYEGPFTINEPNAIELSYRTKKNGRYSDYGSVRLYVVKYSPTISFAKTECLGSIYDKTIFLSAINFSGDVSTIEAHQPKVKYEFSKPYAGATIDAATGVISIIEGAAKNGDNIYVRATRIEDEWNAAANATTGTAECYITLNAEKVVVFDFTVDSPYNMTTRSQNFEQDKYETVVKSISEDCVTINFTEGNYRSWNKNSDYSLKVYTGMKATILSSNPMFRIVNVSFEGVPNSHDLIANAADNGDISNRNDIKMVASAGKDIRKIVVTLIQPTSVFTLPDEIVIPWSEIDDHTYMSMTDIYPKEYDKNVDIKFEPMFAVNNFDVNMGEGCKGHEAGKPNYTDCHWFDCTDINDVSSDIISLGVPCSGLYKLTLSLKEGVDYPVRNLPTKEVTVKVLPSFNASLGDNNGSPLTFNWYSTLIGDQLPINKFHWQSVCHTLVKYHGEGTMTLWYKQEGNGIKYEGNADTDDTHPNYQGPSAQPQSARHRVTSKPGQVVMGAEGTPVEGYIRYGADGLDFTKGEDVNLVFEKNGVYSEPIHFMAYHEDDATITGVDRLVVPEADAEYYTVDGLRIGAGEYLQPGMYVKRQGGKATLVIIR